jgi:transcriptional regulator with XRE-family HTH domain
MVYKSSIMPKRTPVILPSTQRHLREIGGNLKLARLRRRFSSQLVAERADISLPTLRSIERGDGSVTMGAYANVLAVLGLQDDLGLLGRDDVLGRKLQDSELATRARAPKTKRQ